MSLDSLDQELFEQRTRDACRELERRVHAGVHRASESVLADNPDLAGREEFALELIYTEFVTLDELGQRPDPAELYERFPTWQDRLRRLLRVHELLGDELPGAYGRGGRSEGYCERCGVDHTRATRIVLRGS